MEVDVRAVGFSEIATTVADLLQPRNADRFRSLADAAQDWADELRAAIRAK